VGNGFPGTYLVTPYSHWHILLQAAIDKVYSLKIKPDQKNAGIFCYDLNFRIEK